MAAVEKALYDDAGEARETLNGRRGDEFSPGIRGSNPFSPSMKKD